MTDAEQARLHALAEAQQVTVPRLLVEAALSERGSTPSERRDAMVELLALRRVLANTANNVNQLAHAANIDGQLPFDPEPVIEQLLGYLVEIDNVLDGLAAA